MTRQHRECNGRAGFVRSGDYQRKHLLEVFAKRVGVIQLVYRMACSLNKTLLVADNNCIGYLFKDRLSENFL
jgi:hypothetical protein